jgi:FKBP-type peptidyl-prolyl cis-trans isomerase (trigger factor)
MEYTGKNLVFTLDHGECGESVAKITVKLPIIEAMYHQVLLEQKKTLQTEGFSKGTAPLSYIEYTCKKYIIEHLKEFLFNHCVINFLCQEVRKNNLVVAGEPRLTNIKLEPSQDAEFTFIFNSLSPLVKNEWRRCRFKPPARKNYKDLDRQVTTFLKEETRLRDAYDAKQGIKPSDWICFNIEVLNDDNHSLFSDYSNTLWMRMGREDADKDAHALFLGHYIGDSFITKSEFLQLSLSGKIDTSYTFKVTILHHIPHSFFSVPQFKDHFGIKTAKDLHLKLVEVFSYRNDISQRRETAEAALKTILNHYRIEVPRELIEQQKEMVLKAVRRNPDYHVYRAQKDFDRKVYMLAEKQLKEAVVIDHISYQERISINQNDIAGYLNLLLRPRTKEFIYFDLIPTQINGQEQPIPAGFINQSCLREKTLNHIIRALSS